MWWSVSKEDLPLANSNLKASLMERVWTTGRFNKVCSKYANLLYNHTNNNLEIDKSIPGYAGCINYWFIIGRYDVKNCFRVQIMDIVNVSVRVQY